MSSGTNAGTTHQPHYHYHAAPLIPWRLPGQAPYPILIFFLNFFPLLYFYKAPKHTHTPQTPTRTALSLFSLLFSPARNTHPAIPMPLGPMNQIAITTGPRPTHGGYPPTALHQPANHPQTNNSAYPRALKRGGRRRRTPPTTTTIGNTSTRTQTIKAGQLTLLNLSPRHQNYTTPPHHHHRGLPPGAATPQCVWRIL